MQELYYLSGGKKKPVIYFTQDQGEPDLFDQNPNGMSALRQALTAANYVLKPLKFPNADVKVPDDADAVVVAGPQQPMTNSLPALKEYMENSARKGKLIVLLGPTRVDATTHAMRHLGLEDWLRKEWNVDITDEMIFTFQRPVEGIWTFGEPLLTTVVPTNEAITARHPLAQTFKGRDFGWYSTRQIKAGAAKPTLQAQAVMGSYGRVFLENDPSNMRQDMEVMLKSAATRKQLLHEEALPVVVTVAETSMDPHSFSKPGQGQSPRLVVVGCSSLAQNQYASEVDV